MKLVIDRIEESIAVCEDLETKEIIEIETNKLPKEIKDGTVLKYIDGEYKLDLNEEEERRRKLQERFNRLKKD